MFKFCPRLFIFCCKFAVIYWDSEYVLVMFSRKAGVGGSRCEISFRITGVGPTVGNSESVT